MTVVARARPGSDLLGRWRRTAPWRLWVLAVASTGAVATAVALAALAVDGVSRPLVMLGGVAATLVVNRVYVQVHGHGRLLEGIDIAEAPLVALVIALPPAEALLAFVIASVLLETALDRAVVKKVFNVGVRAAGAALMLLPELVAGRPADGSASQYVAVIAGAMVYTAFNLLAVAVVIRSAEQQSVNSQLREGLRARAIVWAGAVLMGVTAGYCALHAPAAVIGLLAAVGLIGLASRAAVRAGAENRRLHVVLDGNSRILSASNVAEQEQALAEIAGDVLLWHDVQVRDEPPTAGEAGTLLTAAGHDRWLIATPRADADPWSRDDALILEILAARTTVAMDRSRMQTELAVQALRDPLTGVANRRRLDEQLTELWRDGTNYAALVIDLDHFKSVNDRFGHAAGDELLRVAAGRLQTSVRANDLVARIGGDEFIVIVDGPAPPGVAARVVAQVEHSFAQPVRIGRWTLDRLPVSVGLATCPLDGVEPRDVLRVADERMYAAKRARATTPRPPYQAVELADHQPATG